MIHYSSRDLKMERQLKKTFRPFFSFVKQNQQTSKAGAEEQTTGQNSRRRNLSSHRQTTKNKSIAQASQNCIALRTIRKFHMEFPLNVSETFFQLSLGTKTEHADHSGDSRLQSVTVRQTTINSGMLEAAR